MYVVIIIIVCYLKYNHEYYSRMETKLSHQIHIFTWDAAREIRKE